ADEPIFGDVFHAVLSHAQDSAAGPAFVNLIARAPVIHEIALGGVNADMSRPVELRSDLADFRGHHLIVKDEPVLSERSAGGCSGNRKVPGADAEIGHLA